MDFAHRRQLIGSMVGDSVGIPKLTPEYLHVCLDLWLIYVARKDGKKEKAVFGSMFGINIFH